MIESLKELNQICQKPNYKTEGNWMVRHILRDAALPVTWLLLHTKITANQVTVISLIAGMFGIVLFSLASTPAFLLGAILVQLWYFLDHVDGQIARYRKTASLSGRFHDFITHHLIHGCILFALGVYNFESTNKFLFILVGFIGSLGIIVFNLINDTKCKTFIEHLYSEDVIEVHKESKKIVAQETNKDWQKRLFSYLHKSFEIHVLMNVI